MKTYLCKVDWEVVVTAENEQKAQEEAQEIYNDTFNISISVKEWD